MKLRSKILLSFALPITFSAQLCITNNVLATSLNNVETSAESTNDILDGDLSYDEGAEVYIPTDEDIALNHEKLYVTSDSNSKNKTFRRSSQGFYQVLSVNCFKQETNYWCGPATVKQTINYMNGSSSSQKTYANQLGTSTSGTDMTSIPSVLNNNISSHRYSYMSIGSFSNYTNNICSALSSGTPIVIDIKATGQEGWPYSTNGHYINISGIDSNSRHNLLMVTDPWYKALGNNWYDASLVYTVNNNHFRQAMIW